MSFEVFGVNLTKYSEVWEKETNSDRWKRYTEQQKKHVAFSWVQSNTVFIENKFIQPLGAFAPLGLLSKNTLTWINSQSEKWGVRLLLSKLALMAFEGASWSRATEVANTTENSSPHLLVRFKEDWGEELLKQCWGAFGGDFCHWPHSGKILCVCVFF